MTELIIIKTDNSQKLTKLLQKQNINYEVYQEPKQSWKTQEKIAFQEWQNLTDAELIAEWENLDDSNNFRG